MVIILFFLKVEIDLISVREKANGSVKFHNRYQRHYP